MPPLAYLLSFLFRFIIVWSMVNKLTGNKSLDYYSLGYYKVGNSIGKFQDW
jgi:hypothetical protein